MTAKITPAAILKRRPAAAEVWPEYNEWHEDKDEPEWWAKLQPGWELPNWPEQTIIVVESLEELDESLATARRTGGRVDVKIGARVECILGLDGEGTVIDGIEVDGRSKTTATIVGTEAALLKLAGELAERCDSGGEGWDLEPADRDACRRAAHGIHKQLGKPLPWQLEPKTRRARR